MFSVVSRFEFVFLSVVVFDILYLGQLSTLFIDFNLNWNCAFLELRETTSLTTACPLLSIFKWQAVRIYL